MNNILINLKLAFSFPDIDKTENCHSIDFFTAKKTPETIELLMQVNVDQVLFQFISCQDFSFF